MKKSAASRFLEYLATDDVDHDDKGSRETWNKLEETGCYHFVKQQIDDTYRSSFSSKLSSGHESVIGFLRGSVFGYVYSKTGDRGFAVKSSDMAVKAALKEEK